MINTSSYDFYVNVSLFDYEFNSVGAKGIIKKIARFDKIGIDIFSFGFGDLDEISGQISDSIISNNGDRDMILATIGQIIYHFTNHNSKAGIFFQGSSPARTRLYQQGLNKFCIQITQFFDVFGYREAKWLPFETGKNYEAFFGRRNDSLLS